MEKACRSNRYSPIAETADVRANFPAFYFNNSVTIPKENSHKHLLEFTQLY